MPPSVASFLCALFIIWLFHQDAKRRQGVSAALWIPLVWAFILGSKPVSFWLGAGDELDSAGGYIQDKFIDKATFLFLIAAGLIVLLRRGADWRQIIQRNKWLFVYFLYLGLSVLWSDSPFVAFKRWVKDAGNVVMVLIVLSEKDPIQAVKALLARSA